MGQEKRRKLALPVSFTSLLTLVLLAVAAMAAAYVWGVMSGRQEVPEPTAAPASTPSTSASVDRPEGPILKARELEFARILKGETRSPPAKKPLAPPTPAPENGPAAASASAAPAESATPAPVGAESGATFDYIFQVAAFKDEQAVDQLRQKLEGHGLRTRMERSGKLYLVLVLLRGNEARASEVMETARSLRLGEPLLRSKKSVSP